jgi:hypothetical protein
VDEAVMDENENPIEGWRRKLKEDGTHDKFKIEKKPSEKEEEGKEGNMEVETFMCNEKNH